MKVKKEKPGKLIIFCGPSGSGKSSIVKYLLQFFVNLFFSISATTRSPRKNEIDGQHYYFFSLKKFQNKVKREEFLEYEEVYPGTFYGTLKAPIDKLLQAGKNVIFDIDVVGALKIKKIYGRQAKTIFVNTPSIKDLRKRLRKRGERGKNLITRLNKAEIEINYAKHFNKRIINRRLDEACIKAFHIVKKFIK